MAALVSVAIVDLSALATLAGLVSHVARIRNSHVWFLAGIVLAAIGILPSLVTTVSACFARKPLLAGYAAAMGALSLVGAWFGLGAMIAGEFNKPGVEFDLWVAFLAAVVSLGVSILCADEASRAVKSA